MDVVVAGVIRRATGADADVVLSLHGRAWASSDRRSLLNGRLASGDCLVSEIDGHVVGFATINRRSFFGRDFLELLVVDADHRREGFGRALLDASFCQSTTPQMFTSTNHSNVAMLTLLRNEQWQLSGELDGIDVGDPEVVFHRRVSA
ncbi:MAG: GNAT family N-acetyltransferase [Acidimicrobiales bacterium]